MVRGPSTLLAVAKQPVAGEAKTRLCPPLTPQQSASLYECFLRDTLDVMREVKEVGRVVCYLKEDSRGYFERLAPDFELRCQRGASLGERLDHVLAESLDNGAERAVVMDSDSPSLPSEYVSRAFDLLNAADVVVGPSEDGGYYLIGMKAPQSHLLRDVEMSTTHVLTDTLRLAASSGLKVATLPKWYDVDTADDLLRLERELASAEGNGPAPATRRWLMEWGRGVTGR